MRILFALVLVLIVTPARAQFTNNGGGGFPSGPISGPVLGPPQPDPKPIEYERWWD